MLSTAEIHLYEAAHSYCNRKKVDHKIERGREREAGGGEGVLVLVILLMLSVFPNPLSYSGILQPAGIGREIRNSVVDWS